MRRLLPLLAAAAVVAAGCTTEATERPPAPSAPPAAPAPARPREIRLDGVDPCSLLTPQQRAELGFTSRPSASRPYVELFGGDVPTCTMDSPSTDPRILGIGTVTSVGVERWRTGDLAARTEWTSVEGFPAVVAQPTRSSSYCAVEVDVASGQLLDVQLIDAGHRPPLPQEELCSGARRAAAAVVRSLLAQ